MIGPNVTVATAGHPILPELREKAYQFNMPVRIGENCWIGAVSYTHLDVYKRQPEDSTAHEGETNETQSADPAKPGETASNQVTAAPSKNAKDWTKAEIIAYFNAGANRVKYQAKSVTRNYTETKNNADKTELPKAIDAIGKSAMKTFMKRDDKAIVLTSKEDIRNVFPVGGKDWVSKLTVSDVKSAKIEDKGSEYQITLTFGTEVNPSGEKGYAAAFGVLTADEMCIRDRCCPRRGSRKGVQRRQLAQIKIYAKRPARFRAGHFVFRM